MDQNQQVVSPETTPKPTAELEEVKLYLDKLNKDVIEVKKQFTSIQRSLDAIYEDRDLLADLGNSIDKIRTLLISIDKHNQNATESVKETVEKKAEEVKMEVAVNSSDVKNNVIKDVVKGIAKSFKREDAKLTKKHWWNYLTFWNRVAKV